MINFNNLVMAIHGAVLKSAAGLRNKNLEIFRDYFETDLESEDVFDVIEQALDEVNNPVKRESAQTLRKKFAQNLDAIALALKSGQGPLQPKCVEIQFPNQTNEGPENHSVYVPLLTLVPMANAQIASMTFKADLEIQTDENNDLQVSFVKKNGEKFANDDLDSGGSALNKANASIEIALKGSEPVEGMKKIIEGYERALRAQIPG